MLGDAVAPSEEQAGLISALKSGEADGFAIAIANRNNETIGYLFPITHALARECGLHERLSRWRQTHMKYFLTSFHAAPEKTRFFLENITLRDPARILFLITDETGIPVGNIGLCSIEEDEAELDNVLRGEPAVVEFMTFAQAALLQWAFGHLKVSRVVLAVLGENQKAIALYKRAGFVVRRVSALQKVTTEDGYSLRPVASALEINCPEQLIYMTLGRADFYSNQNWVRSGELSCETRVRPLLRAGI